MSVSLATEAPTAVGARSSDADPVLDTPPAAFDRRLLLPALFALVNAVAFVIVRPGVNDLWAARARASAVTHGVGLFYWFGWFGGSTPGNYSVITPYLCSWLGTEVVGGIGAVSATVLVAVLVRGTRHPLTAASCAALAAGINLWSGRVPFLLGCAAGVGALIALRSRRRAATVALTLLSILASPVAGAFVAIGLSGTFLTTRTKQWRPIIAWAVATVAVAIVADAIMFGTPGPEPFSAALAIQLLGGLVLLRLAAPPAHLRTTLGVCALAVVILWAIPNGMGSNFARLVWFCLPVVVLATSRRRAITAALLVAPLLVVGGSTTVDDLKNAGQPVATNAYYTALGAQLDTMSNLRNYRVEVVNHGAHAGYDRLLQHASLARGWETQEDTALNAPLERTDLDAVSYKIWLANNAVGYVALPISTERNYPEYRLVSEATPRYLQLVWHDADWRLFRVANATSIVAAPATVLAHSQSSMTVSIPCACTIGVRIRYSRYLDATLVPRAGNETGRTAPVPAEIVDDGFGWTTITTTKPGAYRLDGSISGLVH